MTKLTDENGQDIEDPGEILKEVKTFYENLYQERKTINIDTDMNRHLETLP